MFRPWDQKKFAISLAGGYLEDLILTLLGMLVHLSDRNLFIALERTRDELLLLMDCRMVFDKLS